MCVMQAQREGSLREGGDVNGKQILIVTAIALAVTIGYGQYMRKQTP